MWIKANGGPLAVAVLGVALAGFTTGYGWVLVALGLAWWLGAHLARRSPWELRRKAAVTAQASGVLPGAARHGWIDPSELDQYLASINQTMEQRGFGRNPNLPPVSEPTKSTPSWQELNEARVKRYEENRGLFLIHNWRPSQKEGQVADVIVELCQHQEGPLSRGEVQAVEYTFGSKFSSHSIVSKNAEESFAVTVSLWAPMLCLAKVYLEGDRPPLLLERYVNFDQKGS